MARKILSISYDPVLLATRQMLLEREGYEVISAEGFSEAIQFADEHEFQLVIVGHSIPHKDKKALLAHIRRKSDAPLLALLRQNEAPLPEAAHSIDPSDPVQLVRAVREVLSPEVSA